MRLDCGLCVIRSWLRDDLESVVRHANNRKIWQQLRDRFPHPYTIEDGRRWLECAAAEPRELNFAIEVDGEAAGGIGVVPQSDVERFTAELGYWIGEPFWGRGIVTAAVARFSAHAFEAYDLNRLFALPFADNQASRRVLEKTGFVLEGILRCNAVKDGQIRDSALYAKVRPGL